MLPFLLALACSGPIPDEVEAVVTACVQVEPASLSLGEVEVGVDPPARAQVVLFNACDRDLLISTPEPTPPFSLTLPVPSVLEAEGVLLAEAGFDPQTEGTTKSRVSVWADDADPVELALRGSGRAPVLQLDPTHYDFGALYIGSECVQPFTLSNTGSVDLEVSAIDLAASSDEFWCDWAVPYQGELPWTLPPGEEHYVWVSHQAEDEVLDHAVLTITSTDPLHPQRTASVEGTGTLYEYATEAFTVYPPGQVDVVLTVSRAPSMEDINGQIQAELDTLTRALVGIHDASVQVAAVVDDSGCVVGEVPWVDSTWDSAEAADALLVMADSAQLLSEDVVYTEAGFTLARDALEATVPGGCNEGLLRQGSELHVVHIADSSEESDFGHSTYLSFLYDLHGRGHVRVHAVYSDGTCGEDPDTSYARAVDFTDGQALPICESDWASPLAQAIELSVDRSEGHFELANLPFDKSIAVTVDGAPESHWHYDPRTNAVVLHEDHLPDVGSVVEIGYHLYVGEC